MPCSLSSPNSLKKFNNTWAFMSDPLSSTHKLNHLLASKLLVWSFSLNMFGAFPYWPRSSRMYRYSAKKFASAFNGWLVGWLCWGLTSQSTIFQSCRDGAIASWVINQYFRVVKCLAQGHNTAAVGLEPRTSRSGVRHSTTEPPRSPCF